MSMDAKMLSLEEVEAHLDAMDRAGFVVVARELRAHTATLKADNAALLQEARKASHNWKTMAEMEAGVPGPVHRADCRHCLIVNSPHPGAALLEEHRVVVEQADTERAYAQAQVRAARAALAAAAARHETTRATMHVREEEHRKALVRAMNEGLEKAAALCDAEADKRTATAKALATRDPTPQVRHGHAIAEETATSLAVAADDIRALTEPER